MTFWICIAVILTIVAYIVINDVYVEVRSRRRGKESLENLLQMSSKMKRQETWEEWPKLEDTNTTDVSTNQPHTRGDDDDVETE